ncbi:MAG: glycosyltransferase [Thermoleophilaceae bacterium]|nr:glycosyltransferase [Thermoleophilaceae bacterium]
MAIPVLDGARYLGEVLAAVRAQEVDAEVELLIVDSGSTDGSLEIAADHGATVHEIRKAEFSHGGTRNRMMAMAKGEHVAFLTQDATPVGTGWLAALLAGFEAAEDVAAVFGPHVPRPDASHMIKCEMERHFAVWDAGGGMHVQRLDRSPEALAAYERYPGVWTFLSDVNSCIAKWAWERVPFREVPYAEDQLLGRELIEAGYAKVFSPQARVLHSHDYPPAEFFRRYFDEFRAMREVLGHKEPMGLKRTPWAVRGLTGMDKRWLRANGVSGSALVKPLAVSARHHTLRMAGAIIGSRADRLPAGVRGALSLEGRDSFTPAGPAAGPDDGEPVKLEPNWWSFVRAAHPMKPVSTEPHGGRPDGPMTLAWVVPPWKIGSGGHTTIFRLVQQMERRGHSCSIHLFDPFSYLDAHEDGVYLRRQIREHFVEVDAPVFIGLEGFTGADVAIATNWWTAYPVRDLPGCREKAYLVQDDEPAFYETSAESIWAEDTYRMDYRCIAYTPWMAGLLEERYGAEASWFECGTDLETYPFGEEEGREPGLIAVYARRETGRRAVDLAMAGLAELYRRRPGVRVVLFGSEKEAALPFPASDLHIQPPARLAELYRRASAGVVFSLTTHSLVAHEMMASGLPVVELEGENVSSALGESGELVHMAAHTPDSIADKLERVLDDRAEAAAMAARARAFVEERTWERAGDQVETALRRYLGSPRGEVPDGRAGAARE